MADTDLGPRCLAVGDMLRAETDGPLANVMLFVEVHPGVMTCELFQDVGDRIVYRETSDELREYIWKSWDDEDPRRRWQVMLYHMQNERSEVFLIPAIRLNTEETLLDQRERFVSKILGTKPILYPDLSDEGD